MGSTGDMVTSVTYSVMTPDLEERVRQLVRDEINRELARRNSEHAAVIDGGMLGLHCDRHPERLAVREYPKGTYLCEECA